MTEGRDVEFLCSANGQPAPVITWTKDGKTLTFPALVILPFPEEHGPEQSLHFWGGPITLAIGNRAVFRRIEGLGEYKLCVKENEQLTHAVQFFPRVLF